MASPTFGMSPQELQQFFAMALRQRPEGGGSSEDYPDVSPPIPPDQLKAMPDAPSMPEETQDPRARELDALDAERRALTEAYRGNWGSPEYARKSKELFDRVQVLQGGDPF